MIKSKKQIQKEITLKQKEIDKLKKNLATAPEKTPKPDPQKINELIVRTSKIVVDDYPYASINCDNYPCVKYYFKELELDVDIYYGWVDDCDIFIDFKLCQKQSNPLIERLISKNIIDTDSLNGALDDLVYDNANKLPEIKAAKKEINAICKELNKLKEDFPNFDDYESVIRPALKMAGFAR